VQTQGALLSSHKEKRHGSFGMGLDEFTSLNSNSIQFTQPKKRAISLSKN
jgi:hypothetical protein